MTRAASAGSLFILVSAYAVEKPPLAVSPAELLDSLLSNCFSFFWVAKPLKQAEEVAVLDSIYCLILLQVMACLAKVMGNFC